MFNRKVYKIEKILVNKGPLPFALSFELSILADLHGTTKDWQLKSELNLKLRHSKECFKLIVPNKKHL